MSGRPDDDLVPVSVRLGEVVPPDDPEDWTRPLTWVAALGMLAAPLSALAWFVAAPPAGADLSLGTWLVAAALAAGAAATGATQIGPLRAVVGTLGASLFGALVLVLVGLVLAGERQVGAASPTLAHATAASAAGVLGSAAAATMGAALAGAGSWRRRWPAPAAVGAAVSAVVLRLLAG